MSLSNLQEINTTTCDDYILISETVEKYNQEHFDSTLPKTPLPGIKKRSGSSELQMSVPRQEKVKVDKGQQPTSIWINQYFKELFLRPPFSLAFIIQDPFKYLYNLQNHYIMATTRKTKDDKRTTLKKKFKVNISSCTINLECKTIITEGKPEIINTEKISSKSSHESELFENSNATLETNLESNNSKMTMDIDSRNDNEYLMNFKETNDEAMFWKGNPNAQSKKSSEKFSDDTSKCISSSYMNLMFFNELRDESTDFDEWTKNYSQNNAKKPSKKGGKKEKDSDIDSGDSKDGKKEGKKKKESKKKMDTASDTDAEFGESPKGAKKESKKDKKEKKEVKKKKDAESTDAESGDSKDSKKEKNMNKKGSESTDAESVDSKGAKKEKRRTKKDDKKDALYTDSESDVESKKGKKDEKKETKGNKRKPIKDTKSTDADSESEGNLSVKKGEKKDKKIIKKGEKKDAKKNIESTASDSEFEVKKEKKEAMKDSTKDIGSYSDSASDISSKAGKHKVVRRSDIESEGSLGFKVIKTTDDSDATSNDSKKETSELRRGFKTSSKKTTFRERGEKSVSGRLPSSRERLPLPPCEPLRTSMKPKRVCQCKVLPPPPKPRYAPLPGVEWIHKIL